GVVVGVLEVDVREREVGPVRHPALLEHAEELLERLEAEGEETVGLALLLGDEPDGLLREALRRLLALDGGDEAGPVALLGAVLEEVVFGVARHREGPERGAGEDAKG